jgi:hypothetical protein
MIAPLVLLDRSMLRREFESVVESHDAYKLKHPVGMHGSELAALKQT